MIHRRRWAALLVAACTVMAGLTVTGPANAAVTASTSTTASAAGETTQQLEPFSITPKPTPNLVQPRYPAGSFYYVCVGSDGNTRTLTYGVKTTTCHGSAIQVWLESGQFIRTISLTTTGAVSHPNLKNLGCALGVVGTILIVLAPEATPIFILASSVTVGGTILACATGT